MCSLITSIKKYIIKFLIISSHLCAVCSIIICITLNALKSLVQSPIVIRLLLQCHQQKNIRLFPYSILIHDNNNSDDDDDNYNDDDNDDADAGDYDNDGYNYNNNDGSNNVM